MSDVEHYLKAENSRLKQELEALKRAIAGAGDADLPVVDMLIKDNERRFGAERELADSRTWFELAHEVGGVATYRMDLVADRLWWSQSVYALYGIEPSKHDPSLEQWLDAIHPDDRAAVEEVARAAIDRGASIDHTFRVLLPHGNGVRWIQDRGRVELDEHGRPARLHGVNIDVTAVRRLHDEMERRESIFRQTFEHANVGVAHVSLDGRFIRANPYLCRLLDRAEAELASLTFQDLTHPDDLGTDLDFLNGLLDGSRDTYTMEKRYIRPDGESIWADLSVSLLRDSAGQPLKFVSVIADSHARKLAQEQLELVLAEANHRVKNLLSVAAAIVKNSRRSAVTVEGLETAISQRLHGIAASHDMLMGKSQSGGQLAELIRRQVEIFTDCAIERVKLNGPPVVLTPAAVHAFGMVLHELATNACKYGALSNDDGHVMITWQVDPSGAELVFTWVEVGGPPVVQPDKTGFGTAALVRMLSGSLKGTASLDLAPDGARFQAKVPLAAAVAG